MSLKNLLADGRIRSHRKGKPMKGILSAVLFVLVYAALPSQVLAQDCPIGSHPWVDNWGNRICKSFQGGQEFHDTSKGCPIGMHPWVDKWGNPVCKKF